VGGEEPRGPLSLGRLIDPPELPERPELPDIDPDFGASGPPCLGQEEVQLLYRAPSNGFVPFVVPAVVSVVPHKLEQAADIRLQSFFLFVSAFVSDFVAVCVVR
jgi:hypothetical protein